MPAGHDFTLRALDAGTGESVTLSVDALPSDAVSVEIYRLEDGAYSELAATVVTAGTGGAQTDAGLVPGSIARYVAMGVDAGGERGLPVREVAVRVAPTQTLAGAITDALTARLEAIGGGPRVLRGPEPHPRADRGLAALVLGAVTARQVRAAGSHDAVEYSVSAMLTAAGRTPEIRDSRASAATETVGSALAESALVIAHPHATAVLSQQVRPATPRQSEASPDSVDVPLTFLIVLLQAKGAIAP